MKEIPLTQGRVALVDDEDYERVSQLKWHVSARPAGRWYAVRNIRLPNGKRRIQYLARFVMGLEYGDEHQVDHRDRENTLDNRRENLRVTLTQNAQNIGIPKHNTSGFKGVTWDSGKWTAQISVNNKRKYLGRFLSRELAAVAYDSAAIELHGGFAVTNASLGMLKKPVQSVAFTTAA